MRRLLIRAELDFLSAILRIWLPAREYSNILLYPEVGYHFALCRRSFMLDVGSRLTVG